MPAPLSAPLPVQADVLPGLTDASVSGQPAKVGPNAVIQLAHALEALCSVREARAVFARAGLLDLLDDPPAEMVSETVVSALYRALFDQFGHEQASRIAAEAGKRTADYVMANRIPALARLLLKALPGFCAAPLLLSAIAKNAWTFAGSGILTARKGRPHVIEIADNPLAIGRCAWQEGVFQRMFQVLVSPRVQVVHTDCCETRGQICRFEIWTNRPLSA